MEENALVRATHHAFESSLEIVIIGIIEIADFCWGSQF